MSQNCDGLLARQQLRMILPMMWADFLERVRSTRFLVILLFCVFLTYFFLPAPDALLYANLSMGAARPAYSSAAIGNLTTLLMGEFLPLFAFYLVKGCIERDRRTGIGQVIATTPISRVVFLLGKWLSNTAVIAAIVAIIILAAGFLQFVHGEDLRLDLWALAAPFLIILLPQLVLVAALAVLFESLKLLRSGLGNVVYFGVFALLLGLPIDFKGINLLYPSLYRSCAAQFSGCLPTQEIDIGGDLAGLPTFAYSGISWPWEIIAGRLLFVLAAALIVLLAALLFHRFDPARADNNPQSISFEQVKNAAAGFFKAKKAPAVTSQSAIPSTPEETFAALEPSALTGRNGSASMVLKRGGKRKVFLGALAAELRLALKGARWWWFVGAAGWVIAGLVVRADFVLLAVLPLAWIWPLAIWSGMGGRESWYAVEQLIFSTPHPITRQLAAAWLAGVLVALGTASGVLLRLGILGQWQNLPAILVGALFIPSMALAAGCWTGSSKLFEAVYLFIWYMVAVMGVWMLDFMGIIPETRALGLPWIYAGLALVLAAVAVAGRLRRITR